jgi:hypothetical protein
MIEADTQAIYAAGWFFDVVNICGLYDLLNRVGHGCGIEVDQKKTTATAAGLIPVLDYGGWAHMLEKGDESIPDSEINQ